MARDARETKMHYSPSEKDGVFVVEVARGADSSGVCNGPIAADKSSTDSAKSNENVNDTNAKPSKTMSSRDEATLLNNEEFQVHAPPPDGINDEELLTVDEDGAVSMSSQKLNGDESMQPICGSSHTGLSQSDLSISSSSGSNKDYCYGSQQHYTVEIKGYQSASPRKNLEPSPAAITPNNSKPVITAAIYKQESLDQVSGSIAIEKSPVRKTTQSSVTEEEQAPATIGVTVTQSKTIGDLESNPPTAQPYDVTLQNGSEEFDSLINLPAPPALDEIKLLADITLLENNNMDSLPPPPPPDVIVDGPPSESVVTNGES